MNLSLLLTVLSVSLGAVPGGGECSITCDTWFSPRSCSISGTNVSCYCHWWDGTACCEEGAVIAESNAEGEVIEHPLQSSTHSYAQRGGNLHALLESNVFGFYQKIATELGYDERTHEFIQHFHNLREAHLAGDSQLYAMELEKVEAATGRFSPDERYALTDLALGSTRRPEEITRTTAQP